MFKILPTGLTFINVPSKRIRRHMTAANTGVNAAREYRC